MCPYCAVSTEDAWVFTEHAIAVPHPQPVTPGHSVVAPRRHVNMFYDLDVEEQQAVWGLVGMVRKRIAAFLKVDQFHVGFADDPADASGHAYVHVIPQISHQHIRLPERVEWVEV